MSAENTNTESASWMLLLQSIKIAVKTTEIDKTQVSKLLSAYKSIDDDWMKYVFFDDRHYTYNLIDRSDGHYLMLLAWNPSQGTSIHNHPNATCFVKVLAGSLQEIRYETPQEGQELKVISNSVVGRDDVVYIEDSIGVHEIKNDTPNQVISLHLYVPPYDVCQTFDRETAASKLCPLKFDSMYGKKCDHGNCVIV